MLTAADKGKGIVFVLESRGPAVRVLTKVIKGSWIHGGRPCEASFQPCGVVPESKLGDQGGEYGTLYEERDCSCVPPAV
jgi:hypothetical protein